MAQLMPLPLTVSCFSKIQIGFTFLVLAHPGSPRKRAVKWVCVCVCVPLLYTVIMFAFCFFCVSVLFLVVVVRSIASDYGNVCLQNKLPCIRWDNEHHQLLECAVFTMQRYAIVVYAVVCPSACLSQTSIASKRLYELSWFLVCWLPPIPYCAVRKFGYL